MAVYDSDIYVCCINRPAGFACSDMMRKRTRETFISTDINMDN